MNKIFLTVIIMFFISTSAAFATNKINAGVSYEYVMETKGLIYSPLNLEERLPALQKEFINLGYFIKYTPINMLSSNDLFFSKKKNNHLTPISPMNSTPSMYNISLEPNSGKTSSLASSNLEELAKLNPKRPEFLYGMALKYKNGKNLENALLYTNKALSINPDYALGHFLKGDILREKGNYKEATREYLATIQINPYCTDAYFNIAKIMEMYNRNDIALSYYKMAYAINPNDIEIRNIIFKLEKA